MAKRTKTGQIKHDRTVLDAVKYYQNKGYKVQADLPGYKKPNSINGRVPDVDAKKTGDRVILEVETKDSIKKDISQLRTFQNYADRHNNIRFREKIAQ